MHKDTKSAWLAFATLLFLPPSLSLGQANDPTKGNPERQFAAIHASLLEAADTAIDTTAARSSDTNSIDQPQLAQPESIPPPLKSTAASGGTRSEGLDALVRPILAREGVPNQLAAVIQVESGGNPLALSPKGARGLWQLMPDTARRYGLIVDDHLDERLNLEKSTTTAARYLRDLYAQFGSWPMALAAYNTGEQNLQRAIERARTRDFPILSALGYLPLETRNYVPAVLAAMGSQLSSSAVPADHSHQSSFVYATSLESGQ